MRRIFNIIVAFVLLLSVLVVGYYFIKKPGYKERGEGYTIPMAARDLVRDITGSASPSDDDDEPLELDRSRLNGSSPAVPHLPPAALTREHWSRGMTAYAEGRFSEALPLLTGALDAKQAPHGIHAADEVEVVRLCCRLFDNYPSGEALDGPDVALITSPSGDTFLAEVVSESADRVTFRHKTITFPVQKDRLKDRQIARLDSEKRRLAREEYRRRLSEIEKVTPRRAADYLEQARFARTWGLDEKVGYCVRQGMAASGEGIEKELFRLWQDSSTAQAHAGEIRNLLRHFYPRGDFTRHAWQVSSHSPFAGGGPSDTGSGRPPPPSGIGGTSKRSPRTRDPKVNAILDSADDYREQGDKHFGQTLPGAPDAVEHRRKALDAYTKALELYMQAEELHGVTTLERTITELTKRRYGLLKDTTLGK